MESAGSYPNDSFSVYCHTNKANGKRYVGITKSKVQRRWKNGNGYRNNAHFHSAIMKYGWDGFEHEILFDGLTEAEGKEKERELIAKHHLQDQRYGYNQTAGGDGLLHPTNEVRQKMSDAAKSDKRMALLENARKVACDARRGSKHSSATIQKMSDAKRGHCVSQETRKKISESKKGKPPWNKGIPWSDEAKQKMSRSARHRRQSLERCDKEDQAA